jgi:predicted transcriptional regulator
MPVAATDRNFIFKECSVNDLPLPAIEPERLPEPGHKIELEPSPQNGVAHAEPEHVPTAAEVSVGVDMVSAVHKPISAVMEEKLWTVHAEDSIDKVEEIFATQNLTSAPVVGSNGAIVGMIGAPELAAFHAGGKNAKAVHAWEISRIKTFEVSPTDTVEDVAKLMTENKIENISVTEFGRLKGVVSAQDLLQEMLNVLPGGTPVE